MNTAKQLQIVSAFMAAIVICIPMYVSEAHAATLSVQAYSGRDGVNGFVKRSDSLILGVVASTGETEEIQPDNLRIYLDNLASYTFFQNCTRIAESYSYACMLERSFQSWSGAHSIKIDLHSAQTKYDEFAAPASSETVLISVDIGEAFIENISLFPRRSKSRTANVSFKAVDFGIAEGTAEGCSGIGKVEIYLGSVLGEAAMTKYPSSESCVFEGSFAYTAPAGANEITLCAKAFDRLGQSALESKCAQFSIDNEAPVPVQGSLNIFESSSGRELAFIGGDPVVADISLRIDAEDLDISSVKADLSAIAGAGFASAPPSIHQESAPGRYIFTWKNVQISKPEACIVKVTARDELGNEAATPLPCSITVDTKGPFVNELTTSASKEGVYYIGRKSRIFASITEEGAGLNNRNIFLDLTNINQQSRVRPSNCTAIDSKSWMCFWEVEPTVSDGEYAATVLKESRDDLNNIMEERYTQTIGVDRTSPSINEEVGLNVIPSVTSVPYEGIITSGDNLEFVLQVDDVYSAGANFTGIGGGDDVLPTSCWKVNESTYCKWDVQVASSGPYTAQISFNFMDFAGNINSIEKSIPVAGFIEAQNPDYWKAEVSCSPSSVDLELSSMLAMTSYCHLKLKPKTHPNAEVMSFGMEAYPSKCFLSLPESNATITDYVSDIITINNVPGSVDPYMILTLQTFSSNPGDFSPTCSFEIFTKIGDEYTLYPEIENVTAPITFYGNPYGTLDSEYDNKIKDTENKLEWLDGWFDELMSLFDYMKRACELYGVLNNIVSVLTILTTVTGEAQKTYSPLAGAYKASCGGEDKFKDGLFGMGKIFKPMCAFINCNWANETLSGAWSTMAGGSSVGQSQTVQAWTKAGFDVKESLVWSLATLCVPGILYNINKWAQIECQYGLCMLNQVPAGYPEYVCSETRGYMMCRLVWGQVLNAIPWYNMYSNAMEMINQNLADPLSGIFWIVNIVLGCTKVCNPGTETAKRTACGVMSTISMIGKAIEDIEGIQENGYFDQVGDSACVQFRDALEDYNSGD